MNSASYVSALAPETIATGYGSDLAVASSAVTTVTVKDSGGTTRKASLIYAFPQQIAFLIPAGTATSPATITVTSGDGTVSTVTVQISAVGPGLFSPMPTGRA